MAFDREGFAQHGNGEADRHHRRDIADDGGALGPDHPDVAQILTTRSRHLIAGKRSAETENARHQPEAGCLGCARGNWRSPANPAMTINAAQTQAKIGRAIK